MLLDARTCACLELVEGEAGFGDADDRYIEVPMFHHRMQCWENFLKRQIARCTEEYQGVGVGVTHRRLLPWGIASAGRAGRSSLTGRLRGDQPLCLLALRSAIFLICASHGWAIVLPASRTKRRKRPTLKKKCATHL